LQLISLSKAHSAHLSRHVNVIKGSLHVCRPAHNTCHAGYLYEQVTDELLRVHAVAASSEQNDDLKLRLLLY